MRFKINNEIKKETLKQYHHNTKKACKNALIFLDSIEYDNITLDEIRDKLCEEYSSTTVNYYMRFIKKYFSLLNSDVYVRIKGLFHINKELKEKILATYAKSSKNYITTILHDIDEIEMEMPNPNIDYISAIFVSKYNCTTIPHRIFIANVYLNALKNNGEIKYHESIIPFSINTKIKELILESKPYSKSHLKCIDDMEKEDMTLEEIENKLKEAGTGYGKNRLHVFKLYKDLTLGNTEKIRKYKKELKDKPKIEFKVHNEIKQRIMKEAPSYRYSLIKIDEYECFGGELLKMNYGRDTNLKSASKKYINYLKQGGLL